MNRVDANKTDYGKVGLSINSRKSLHRQAVVQRFNNVIRSISETFPAAGKLCLFSVLTELNLQVLRVRRLLLLTIVSRHVDDYF